MRGKKQRKPIDVTCIDCGCTFKALTRKALRCEACKKNIMYQYRKRKRAWERELNRKNELPHLRPKMSIAEVLKEQEKYNKEHKTHISYGRFVLMLEGANGNNKNIHKHKV